MDTKLKNAETLERLMLYLESQDSGFVIVEVNENQLQKQAANYVADRLRSIVVDFKESPHIVNPYQEIKKRIEKYNIAKICLILNMHTLKNTQASLEKLVRDLNFAREAYSGLEKILVFFFPVFFTDMVIRLAKDFFDFVPVVFRLEPESSQMPEYKIEKEQKEILDENFVKNRIAFLENYINETNLSKKELTKKYNDIAKCYEQLSKYDKALDYYKQALEISKEIGDKAGLCATLFNLGHIYYYQQGDKEKAMKTWAKVYSIAKPMHLAEAFDHLEKLVDELGLPEGLAAWENVQWNGTGGAGAW